jgi:hypothetical protein
VLQSPPSLWRYAPETRHEHEDDPTGAAHELMCDDASDATFEEFDRLTLVDYHSDEEPNEAGYSRQLTSLPQQQPSRPPSRPLVDPPLAASSQSSLLHDPYSLLSPLQRAIIVQLYNNSPLFPDGVPILTIFRGVNHTTGDKNKIPGIR